MYWVKYRTEEGSIAIKCRLFYDYNNAVDFANTIPVSRMVNYNIPGY